MILAAAHGGILLIDDIALLPDNITDILLNVLSEKCIRLERDGISFKQDCSFIMIATADSSKAQPRKSLTDHFGMYAKAEKTLQIQPLHKKTAQENIHARYLSLPLRTISRVILPNEKSVCNAFNKLI